MKSLELFNAVIVDSPQATSSFEIDTEYGFILPCSSGELVSRVRNHFKEYRLKGDALNKTFYSQWSTVKSMTREALAFDQIRHYLSTYGTNFNGEIYLPNSNSGEDLPLKFIMIKTLTKEEAIEKALEMLKSGVALKQETVEDLIDFLSKDLSYRFTGEEGIRNKEANVLLADKFQIYPENPQEFLRYIVYKCTGETLVIKSPEVVDALKASDQYLGDLFRQYGYEKLATIFNRNKAIFLALKSKNRGAVNKISKLSKKHHIPMKEGVLGRVTSILLVKNDQKALEKVNTFQLLRAMNACYTRINGQKDFIYNIRNGKTWMDIENEPNTDVCKRNFKVLLQSLYKKLNYRGKTVYIPQEIEYALPVSQKKFTGNLPFGTRFTLPTFNVGMYWENAWGARDLDLSTVNISGQKVGWNARYDVKGLTYSGDITSAPNGAVEYMRVTDTPGLSALMINVYSGNDESGFKLILGKGSGIKQNYMQDPSRILVEEKSTTVKRNSCIGLISTYKDTPCFYIYQGSINRASVSGEGDKTFGEVLNENFSKMLTLNSLLEGLGAKVVRDRKLLPEDGIDLSIENLEKDTLINLITEK